MSNNREVLADYFDDAQEFLGPGALPTQLQTILIAMMFQVNDLLVLVERLSDKIHEQAVNEQA